MQRKHATIAVSTLFGGIFGLAISQITFEKLGVVGIATLVGMGAGAISPKAAEVLMSAKDDETDSRSDRGSTATVSVPEPEPTPFELAYGSNPENQLKTTLAYLAATENWQGVEQLRTAVSEINRDSALHHLPTPQVEANSTMPIPEPTAARAEPEPPVEGVNIDPEFDVWDTVGSQYDETDLLVE